MTGLAFHLMAAPPEIPPVVQCGDDTNMVEASAHPREEEEYSGWYFKSDASGQMADRLGEDCRNRFYFAGF